MRVADAYLGNVAEDAELAARIEADDALTVALDDTERRRSRVRTATDDGSDLGIVVARDLRAGDVLATDDALVLVALDSVEALVVDLGGVEAATSSITGALALGHAVGNRHWDLAIDGDRAYLPVADAHERMEAEIEPHLPDGATVGYEEVSPSLFDDDTDGTDGSGGDGRDGGHSHAHEEGDRSHASGHSHSHESEQSSHSRAGDGRADGGDVDAEGDS